MISDAMLMAAGLGTRLRPFTEAYPKALLPLLDVPMAQFAADALAEARVSNVVANVHHHAKLAERELRNLEFGGADLQISDESALLLGSAGGIRKALPRFDGRPFFLLNSDVLMDLDLAALARAHARLRSCHGVVMTLAVLRTPPAFGKYREIRVASTGLISGFGDVVAGKPFFTGAAVFEPEALEHVPSEGPSEFLEKMLAPAVAAGKAGAFVFEGLWRDIGSPTLWYRTHFELMQALETGRVSPRLRRRLDRANRRVAQGLWVSRRAGLCSSARLSGAGYWSPEVDAGARAPRKLPGGQLPRGTVLYGDYRGNGAPGIGFANLWEPIS